MTRHPRILVSGYYGFGNAGDEAILAGLVQGVRGLAPDAELTVLSGNPEATAAEHDVAGVPRGFRSAFAHMSESDLLISGGGGLLQDATSWRSPLYYLGIIQLALTAGVPVACIGHSIGPLRRPWARSLTRYTLSKVALLSVRDGLSQAALRALGVTREVYTAADPAFILSPPSQADTAAAWERAQLATDPRPSLTLALRRPPGTPSDAIASALAEAIGPPCQQLGLRPLLIPMQFPADVEFAHTVAARLPLPAEIVRPRLTAREVLALIGGCDLVVAMRLHALIFGAICRRPLVAISYDPKVVGLMGELGLPIATSTDHLDPQELSRSIVNAWQDRERSSAALAARVNPLAEAARQTIALALALLHNRTPEVRNA